MSARFISKTPWRVTNLKKLAHVTTESQDLADKVWERFLTTIHAAGVGQILDKK